MDLWTDAVDIATVATGLPAVSVWNTGRVNAFRQNRAVNTGRVWNIGSIMMGITPSWDVRLADDDSPDRRTGRVIVDVWRAAGGETDPQMDATFRKAVKSEG